MATRTWLAGATLLGAALTAACGDGGEPDATATATVEATVPTTASSTAEATATVTATVDAPEERNAQVRELLAGEFPLLDTSRRTVELREIVPLLPPDGIPAIDEPNFDAVASDPEWLTPQEPVIALEIDGDARAYPLQILMWHEIVNDTVGGRPVIVTYCPLCNSAITFSREVEGEARTFAVSGKLRRSDLIMFDRETQTLWQQLSGEAIVGSGVGTTLEFLPSTIVSWEQFRTAFPDGMVLNRETGHFRQYGENPYVLYDSGTSFFAPVDEFVDDRYPAKERVLVIDEGGDPVAFPFSALLREVVIHSTVAGEPVVVFWQDGAVSALDNPFITDSRSVGSAAAYRPFLDGERLTFEFRDGTIVDVGTGSRWNVLGRAVEGPLAGTELEEVVSGSHFWFAWSVFQPDTRIVTASDDPTVSAGG